MGTFRGVRACSLIALLALTAGPAQAQGLLCLNSCPFAFDGECDDGGPGSLTSACVFGTDCGDCGPRTAGGGGGAGLAPGFGCGEDRPNEPVSVCENTCRTAFDGVCDDQGPCPVGSDCGDCGPRTLPRGELGGCTAGGAPALALLALGLLWRRRRVVVLVLLLTGPNPSWAGTATEPDASASSSMAYVEGGGVELVWGLGAGASLGPEGGASLGPRARIAVGHAVTPGLLLGGGGTAQVGLLLSRPNTDLGPTSAAGGRAHLDLFFSACAAPFSGLSCVDAGGFVATELAWGLEGRALGSELGAGPLLVLHALPRANGHTVRSTRIELGWDAVRGRFELRLGFEL